MTARPPKATVYVCYPLNEQILRDQLGGIGLGETKEEAEKRGFVHPAAPTQKLLTVRLERAPRWVKLILSGLLLPHAEDGTLSELQRRAYEIVGGNPWAHDRAKPVLTPWRRRRRRKTAARDQF